MGKTKSKLPEWAKGKRKFRVGQWVQTRAGTIGKVIGSAKFPYGIEYRIKPKGSKRTMYRLESQLMPYKPRKQRKKRR